jgi:glycosyltransferase involved in cell wall biosynthesis
MAAMDVGGFGLRRLRITIILGPYYPVPTALGGAVEKVQLQLAEAYAAAGHDVTLISRQFADFPRNEVIAGVHHIRIPSFDRDRNHLANFLHDIVYSWRASRAIPVSDVTVTNGFSLPFFLPRQEAGRIYVHVARFPKRHFFLYRRADRFQAVSSAVAQAIVRQAPILAKKVIVIGNPLSLRYFTKTPKEPRIVYVGRIAREKGIDRLVQAFVAAVTGRRCAPEWSLRIVGPHAFEQGGDGLAYLEELKAIAAPVGEQCRFVGPIFSEDDLISEYAAASIFVYPTLAAKGEAFGLAPLEAMAAGCATIVSKLACFDDYVRNGVNALQLDFMAKDCVKQLDHQLTLLMNDPGRRDELGEAGRTKAEEFLSPIIAKKMLEDFECLLSHG